MINVTSLLIGLVTLEKKLKYFYSFDIIMFLCFISSIELDFESEVFGAQCFDGSFCRLTYSAWLISYLPFGMIKLKLIICCSHSV